MTDFTDEILADEGLNAIITASGTEILIESVPSGNLNLILVSGSPVVSERGTAARIYNTGQIEVHDDGGFLVMSDNYQAGEAFAASTANGTAVYRVPNYDGIGFSRGDNVYVELRTPGEPFESSDNPYYLLTNTATASTRFLGRAERDAISGSTEVFVRTMAPKFGV